MTLVNCTINGNTAGASGNGGGISSAGTLTLVNCTIAGNSAKNGGNVFSVGTAQFQNTIIAGGTLLGSGGTGADLNGTLTSSD